MLGETLIFGWFCIIFNIIGNNSLLIYKSICVWILNTYQNNYNIGTYKCKINTTHLIKKIY